MDQYLTCGDVKYDQIASNIPSFMQTLYIETNIKSIELSEVRDAFRINQMQGKSWLLNQLSSVSHETKILVIGSWIGFTSYCLHKIGFKYITETDIDNRFTSISEHLNSENSHFKHLNSDINGLDLSPYGLVINTSCEHIGDNTWFDRISSGCLVALQSTNLKWHDHVNTVESVEEMKLKYNLNLQYSGELKFNDVYSRFMLVGTKP